MTERAPTRRGLALVAGGSGAIGAAICATLARDGYDVTLTYRSNEAAAKEAAAAVEHHGRAATIHQVDLTDAAATAAYVTGPDSVDVVVYAAGPYIPMDYIGSLTPEQFAHQINHDTLACYHLLHPSLPTLRKTNGRIVAISTPAIRRYASRDVLSAAPKAAIEQMIRGIASEYGKYGIRANAVGVGLIDAGLYDDLLANGHYDDHILDIAKRNIPLRRFGTATDIAEAVAFLASDRAGWITGQVLDVDGGYSV